MAEKKDGGKYRIVQFKKKWLIVETSRGGDVIAVCFDEEAAFTVVWALNGAIADEQ